MMAPDTDPVVLPRPDRPRLVSAVWAGWAAGGAVCGGAVTFPLLFLAPLGAAVGAAVGALAGTIAARPTAGWMERQVDGRDDPLEVRRRFALLGLATTQILAWSAIVAMLPQVQWSRLGPGPSAEIVGVAAVDLVTVSFVGWRTGGAVLCSHRLGRRMARQGRCWADGDAVHGGWEVQR